MIAEGDLVAARVLSTGTNRDGRGAPPPTGNSFAARQSRRFRFAGGQLIPPTGAAALA